VQAFRSPGAQVIAFQELGVSQSEATERKLSEEGPYRILKPGGFEGKGLISHHPITSAAWLSFHPSRPDLRCIVGLEGRLVTFILAHPHLPSAFRA